VPFAANMVYYDSKSVINYECANTFDFSDFCKKNYKNLYTKVLNLFPGDFVIKNNNTNLINSKNFSRSAFFKKLKNFLDQRTKIFNNEYKKFILDKNCEYIDCYNQKLKKVKKINLDREIYITTKNPNSKMIKIETSNRNIKIVDKFKKKKNSYIFYFEPKPLISWLKGNVSFEDILNSQRFTVDRFPEEFKPNVWNYIRENL
jgi:hypothetical protein